jgi:Leucine-rich repeat (LRR) protein
MFSTLRILNVSNNRLTSFPAEVGQLADLEILDLSGNEITQLPNEIENLITLIELDLRGNPLTEQEIADIEKALPNTTVRF